MAEIRALERSASAAEPVLYVDEVDVHLNPKIGREWMSIIAKFEGGQITKIKGRWASWDDARRTFESRGGRRA